MRLTPDALKWLTKRRRTVEAYRRFFASDDGKLVLEDLRGFCGYRDPIIDTADVNLTMSRLGARSVFLRILSRADVTDEQLMATAERMSRGET